MLDQYRLQKQNKKLGHVLAKLCFYIFSTSIIVIIPPWKLCIGCICQLARFSLSVCSLSLLIHLKILIDNLMNFKHIVV